MWRNNKFIDKKPDYAQQRNISILPMPHRLFTYEAKHVSSSENVTLRKSALPMRHQVVPFVSLIKTVMIVSLPTLMVLSVYVVLGLFELSILLRLSGDPRGIAGFSSIRFSNSVNA